MRACVIHNPQSGSASQMAELMSELHWAGKENIWETDAPGDATKFAKRAAEEGFDVVVAAGGDGTIHEVINGLMKASDRRPTLGVLPLGTGNDPARTLNVPLDPREAIEVLRAQTTQQIDLIKASWGQDNMLFGGNVAAGGFTGQVDEALTDEVKARWGPLAYVRGAIGVLPDLTHYKTTICYDNTAMQVIRAMNIIVANGRTAGGGTVVAPTADPGDGLLDVVIVRNGTITELAGVAARLLGGDYTSSDLVTHRRAKRVVVESTPGMWFNIDGELVTKEAITFEVAATALRVIVGPPSD